MTGPNRHAGRAGVLIDVVENRPQTPGAINADSQLFLGEVEYELHTMPSSLFPLAFIGRQDIEYGWCQYSIRRNNLRNFIITRLGVA